MNNNKKLLIYGSVAAVILIAGIVMLSWRLFSAPAPEDAADGPEVSGAIYRAVPSDAVMICEAGRPADFAQALRDSTAFGFWWADRENGLVKWQERLSEYAELQNCTVLFSLHYSAKNSVSLLEIADLSGTDAARAEQSLVAQYGTPVQSRTYNRAKIHTFADGLNVSFYRGLLLASPSAYVLESSIRHLENETSILDNPDFVKLLGEREGNSIFVNHHQIGKFFSGTVAGPFLGYSDFFLRFSSWSRFRYGTGKGHLELRGQLLNHREEKYFSSLFFDQLCGTADFGKVLPAGTVFAASLPLADGAMYIDGYRKFLEVHKRLGGYEYQQHAVRGENKLTPAAWLDSLGAREIVSAYCRFGDKYEWVTLIRKKPASGFDRLLSRVMDREAPPQAEAYPYKGYMASLFGELFAHTNEESYCRKGEWTVIGPAGVVEEFARDAVGRFTLDEYMGQTPAGHFLKREALFKLVANVKEGADSLLKLWQPYPARLLRRTLDHTNYAFLTAELVPDGDRIGVEADYYDLPLPDVPRPRARKEKAGEEESAFGIDSTIAISRGPFELIDFVTGGTCYLEQTENLRIRYMDGKKKSVWAIPFDTPIGGRVEQADLFGNGKLQMLFVSGRKLYALDRMGRYVNKYPAELPKAAVYGPKLVEMDGGRWLLVLNEDNTVSRYGLDGKLPAEWTDLQADEFVKELPELLTAAGQSYWVLRTVLQTRIYTASGRQITGADTRRRIPRESELTPDGNRIRFKGEDGKEYVLELESGKIKKP